jgi:hypothetical protein
LADENCARTGAAAEKCVAAGTVAALDHCQDTSDCRPGLVCADTLCDPPCGGTCPTDTSECLVQYELLDDGGVVPLGYSVCEPHCNPVFPTTTDQTHIACGQGQRCELSHRLTGVTYCDYPAGPGTQGMACSKPSDCASGYDCLIADDAGGSGVCERYCHLGGGGNASCSSGTTCQALPTTLYDGALPIGVCQ